MPTVVEGSLTFEFPEGWKISKFDEWSFYRKQFNKGGEARVPCPNCKQQNVISTKAIDILAIDAHSCCWSIEVKDYRQNRREKVIDLADEVALKVRDTLAALVAAQVNANDSNEQTLAREALRCSRLRVILHLEQPAKPSKLFPRPIDPTKVQQRLKQLVKAIDPHPQILEMGQMGSASWSVK